MKRLVMLSWWLALSCTACGAHSTSVVRTPAKEQGADTCSSTTAAGVSAATAQRLAKASNIIEYENLWKAEHPELASGTISGSAVRSQIHAELPQVQACYESALNGSGDGSGRVVVRFVIDRSGRVAVVNISSNSFAAPDVGCCLVQHVVRWQFPKPAGADFVVVEYPFVVRISHGN